MDIGDNTRRYITSLERIFWEQLPRQYLSVIIRPADSYLLTLH